MRKPHTAVEIKYVQANWEAVEVDPYNACTARLMQDLVASLWSGSEELVGACVRREKSTIVEWKRESRSAAGRRATDHGAAGAAGRCPRAAGGRSCGLPPRARAALHPKITKSQKP